MFKKNQLNEKKVSTVQPKTIDQEWLDLMKEAQAIGLTPKDIQRFLNRRRENIKHEQ
ncbi:anti-repressor SinI family protein [Alkalibacillus silvisoli]|uniref:Sin domain-containing protein n=1 Tax=Alkalibacillus silvisoli TaxID=392823 RepID=A0ABN0ZNF9_9BACI